MKAPSDKLLARRMLEYRERGYTFGRFFRRNLSRYLFLLAVTGGTLALLAQLRFWALGCLVLGMVFGALLRDLGWVRSARRSWPFTRKVMDWEKVRQLAEEPPPEN